MFATVPLQHGSMATDSVWDLPVVAAGLVDVDATAIVQFGFFLALILILPKLVFEPLLARFEQREARTEGARKEARRMLKEADEQVVVYEKAMAEEKQRALAERAAARAAAQKEAAELVTKVRKETNERIDAGIATLRAEADKARTAIEGEAEQIAALITSKVIDGKIAEGNS